MDSKMIKILGFVATIVGIGASLLSDFVGDKKLEMTIDEKVTKALATK